MTAHKTSALPDRCRNELVSSAAHTRAVLWQTFHEHYPFFLQAGVNWADYKAQKAAALNAQSAGQFFDELVGMIKPLADAHVALAAPSLESFYFGAETHERAVDPALEAAIRFLAK